MRRGLSSLSFIALSAVLASPALAEQGDEPSQGATQASRTTTYDAAFFEQYAPRTALDIARRVPGFALDLGNQDTRGFAGAAGNVVINGARPSSKAETLETTLARIPATRVLRVEVGPGDLYGSEYSTKSQVLNVVLSAEGGIDGNVTASARRLYTGRVVPDINGSALIRRGNSTINLSAGTANVLNLEEGTDVLTNANTGEFIEHRRKFNSYRDFNPYFSGSWAIEEANNKSVRLNARWSPRTFYLTQDNHVRPAAGPERDDYLFQDFKNPVFEIGGDVTRPLAGGAIKLVGLATRRERDWLERYLFRAEGGVDVLGGFEQQQDAQRNETILRLNWTRQNLAGFSFEAGVEGVLNTLDHQVKLFELLAGGEPVRIDLPIDEAKVEEKRAEGFIRVGRQLSKAIRLDLGLNYEISDLAVSGDTEANRTLNFWKPSFTLDWRGGNGWHGQLSVRRTVAQLDFYDFISAAELSSERVNAGNPNLMPQQTWEFRGTLERPLLGDGLAKVDVGFDLVNELQDRVLIFDDEGNGFDAPGNLGTGKRYFARLTLDAPLARLGLTGVRVKFDGLLQRTRVEDPISGEMRSWTGHFPDWEWSVEARHDVNQKLSYGISLLHRDDFSFFRTDEFASSYNSGVYGTAFIEYRPRNGTTITLDVDNALNTSGHLDRVRFFPNRANPLFIIDEIRERNRHLNFGLTLKQTFGGGGNGSRVAQAG